MSVHRIVTKRVRLKLDPFAAKLDDWLTSQIQGGEALDYAVVKERLRREGCKVSTRALSRWWARRQINLREDALMKLVVTGAQQSQDLDAALTKNPAPHINTLLALFKLLIMELTTKGVTNPQFLKLSDQLARTATRLIHTQAQAAFWKQQQALAEERFVESRKAGRVKALEGCLQESEKFPAVQELFRTAFLALRKAREA